MTVAQRKQLQEDLNAFTKKYLRGVAPLIVDGKIGHATKVRIQSVKYCIGYGKTREANSFTPSEKFLRALRSPKSGRLGAQVLAAGVQRRLRQRARSRQQGVAASRASGVTKFDGVPVAKWLVPYLVWARKNGWRGRLNSGWRSPSYSDSLCRRICGAPYCPGRCAGRRSNHAGSAPPPAQPSGALDVSDYITFKNLMLRAPFKIKLYNAMPRTDPVHFSTTGH